MLYELISKDKPRVYALESSPHGNSFNIITSPEARDHVFDRLSTSMAAKIRDLQANLEVPPFILPEERRFGFNGCMYDISDDTPHTVYWKCNLPKYVLLSQDETQLYSISATLNVLFAALNSAPPMTTADRKQLMHINLTTSRSSVGAAMGVTISPALRGWLETADNKDRDAVLAPTQKALAYLCGEDPMQQVLMQLAQDRLTLAFPGARSIQVQEKFDGLRLGTTNFDHPRTQLNALVGLGALYDRASNRLDG